MPKIKESQLKVIFSVKSCDSITDEKLPLSCLSDSVIPSVILLAFYPHGNLLGYTELFPAEQDLQCLYRNVSLATCKMCTVILDFYSECSKPNTSVVKFSVVSKPAASEIIQNTWQALKIPLSKFCMDCII